MPQGVVVILRSPRTLSAQQRHRLTLSVERSDLSADAVTCQQAVAIWSQNRVFSHQLDELGLPAGAGLGKQMTQMRLDRGLADT